ncbi:MAG: glycosyltransferase [Oscillospiraceae bacterium]|nr:glycosyltransferase [Oscillospiraceae bacterium]
MDGKGSPIRVAQILGKMNGGGAEQVVMNYYKAIDRSRVQFDFFAFKSSKLVPAEEIKGMGGGLYMLCGFKNPIRYVRTLTALLRDNNYGIVHCHLSTLSFLPLLAAKRAGVSVRIVHNHSTSGGKRELVRNVAKALLKPLAKLHATHRFACSEFAARWMYGASPTAELSETGLPEKAERKTVRIMRNAIDTELFRFNETKRSSFRGEFGVAGGTLLFGHVGRFCPQKNQQFLIDIFREILRQHRNSKLIMAGVGEDMELIRARVIAAGIADRVIFAGQRVDVDRLYSAIDCFLLPSNYEGLPVVGVEAQCAGLESVLYDDVTRGG